MDAPVRPRFDDLEFLLGHWTGQRQDERYEETWTRPDASTMLMMFAWMRTAAPPVFEHCVLENQPSGGHLTMRVFVGSGSPADRPDRPTRWTLVESEAGLAVFDAVGDARRSRIVYQARPGAQLHAALHRDEEEQRQVYPYHYRAERLERR